MTSATDGREVWITGIGLISSLGEGARSHWERLSAAPQPEIDAGWLPPYPVHGLPEVDFSRYIPKRSDQRQMEMWQRIGCYGAGMALEDAGIRDNADILERTALNIAAGSGERDTAVDQKVLDAIAEREGIEIFAKEILPGALKPTLFLAQLANLLAGNISIIHNVTGASRTFMGEEMAGVSAIEDAWRRIAVGSEEIFLTGGALNARRADLLLNLELGRYLWAQPYAPVWDRRGAGGMVMGSVGVFLVLEARAHAEERGVRGYARLAGVASGRAGNAPGDRSRSLAGLMQSLDASGSGSLGILSGASGAEPALSDERSALQPFAEEAKPIRAYGSVLGHMLEAHFPAGVALAALALQYRGFYPPFSEGGIESEAQGGPENVLVTAAGHWQGEGAALLSACGD